VGVKYPLCASQGKSSGPPKRQYSWPNQRLRPPAALPESPSLADF